MINIEEVKSKIISFLENNGPSIPVKIAKEIKMDPVMASAILSELTHSQNIRTSSMKVGSSQIFFITGQNQKLESFADEYLGGPEKKAYLLLKEKKYLIDNNQEPSIRVALRSLKDFAIPFKHEEQVMWRYSFYPKEEIQHLLESENKNKKVTEENVEKQEPPEQKEEKPSLQEHKIIEEKREEPKKEAPQKQTQEHLFIDEEKKEAPLKEKPKVNKTAFYDEVLEYLEHKNIKISKEIDISRNEFIASIQINSDLGKLEYLLIARNKKSINDSDILVASQKASEVKMPAYLLHKGKLTKKGQETLEQYKNLIKVNKI